jgi:hypothetical protein
MLLPSLLAAYINIGTQVYVSGNYGQVFLQKQGGFVEYVVCEQKSKEEIRVVVGDIVETDKPEASQNVKKGAGFLFEDVKVSSKIEITPQMIELCTLLGMYVPDFSVEPFFHPDIFSHNETKHTSSTRIMYPGEPADEHILI